MKTTSLLAALALLAACGGPAAQPFVGTWTTNGTFTSTTDTSAGPVTETQQLSSESRSIAEGATSDLVVDWNGCEVPATVRGSIATLQPNFVCTQDNGSAAATLTFASGTATLNGSTMAWTASGTFSVTQGGQTATGTFTDQEALTKVSK